MSECITQEDAMNMSTEQAIQILKPMQSMMRDQHGCPISDAYFALEKAIEELEKKADAVEVVRCKDCGAFRKFATKKYEWETDGFCNQTNWCMRDDDYCSDGERRSE